MEGRKKHAVCIMYISNKAVASPILICELRRHQIFLVKEFSQRKTDKGRDTAGLNQTTTNQWTELDNGHRAMNKKSDPVALPGFGSGSKLLLNLDP